MCKTVQKLVKLSDHRNMYRTRNIVANSISLHYSGSVFGVANINCQCSVLEIPEWNGIMDVVLVHNGILK